MASASSVTSTPINSNSKRCLSNSSTPSPNSKVTQTSKKPKLPEDDSDQSCKQSSTSNVEMSYEDIVKSVVSEVTEQLKTTLSEHVNASVKSMAQSVADIISSSLNDRMSSVEVENKQLRDQVTQLTARVQELEQHKHSTAKNFDNAEQYSRRSCLRISGVAETPEESVDGIVLDIAHDCEVDLKLEDIDRSHRLPTRQAAAASNPKPADIIVKFVSYRSRAALLSCKSHLKNSVKYKGVYINEDLTRYRAGLLRSARLLVKSGKVQSAWSRDGRIFIKKNDGSRMVINSEDDMSNM